MLKDHQKDVDLFKKASQHADDAALRNWVAKTPPLPVLQKHLDAIEQIKSSMK